MAEPWTFVNPAADCKDFETEAAALETAAEEIEKYLDDDNGWLDGVRDLYVSHAGRTTHRVKEVAQPIPDDELERMEEDPDYQPPFDYYCTYVMTAAEPVEAGNG
jgi:hypothetical protein